MFTVFNLSIYIIWVIHVFNMYKFNDMFFTSSRLSSIFCWMHCGTIYVIENRRGLSRISKFFRAWKPAVIELTNAISETKAKIQSNVVCFHGNQSCQYPLIVCRVFVNKSKDWKGYAPGLCAVYITFSKRFYSEAWRVKIQPICCWDNLPFFSWLSILQAYDIQRYPLT